VSTTGGKTRKSKVSFQSHGQTVDFTDIWKSYESEDVKAVLLYTSESWTVTQRTADRIQMFINKCLRSILNIHWTDRITNKELWKTTSEQSVLERL